jgi:ribonuclease HI
VRFDGSCDPNPGGRLGYGWVLTLADGTETTGRGEQPPAPGNTNNLGEYQGLSAGLAAYIAAGRRGPLRVIGDSQLIIGQMVGAMRAKDPALARQRDHARQLAAQITGGVEFHWERRASNAVADQLAGDGKSSLPPPADRRYALGANVNISPISAATRSAIIALNANPAPGFRDFMRLTVGGADTISARGFSLLVAQAGEETVAAVRAAFPDEVTRQAAVLRWCMRGLAVELAIRKGQVDADLAAQAGRSRGA